MPIATATPSAIERYRFTVEEFHTMIESGIFSEEDRVELINGELIPMTPVGPQHSSGADRLTMLFASRLAGRAIVRVQSPIVIGAQTQPEPDVALLRWREDFYETKLPDARDGDALLVVEIAVSTLRYDRDVKLPLYAEAGVPEVWIVNVDAQTLDVYREPNPDGYARMRRSKPGDTVHPQHFDDVDVLVGAVLPKPPADAQPSVE